MKNIMTYSIIGLILLAGIVIALPGIPIANGFQLSMPPLPPKNGPGGETRIIGACVYTGTLQAQRVNVWNNYLDNNNENRLEYSFLVRPGLTGCPAGFKGNITYQLDPVQAIQQDFSNQILTAIHDVPPVPHPIAMGNDVPDHAIPPPPPINNTNSTVP